MARRGIEPIPPEAMPVVEILRRDVPRPKRRPEVYGIQGLGEDPSLRWKNKTGYSVCPMGLHPQSQEYAPEFAKDFAGGMTCDAAVLAFYEWWDRQISPAAMNKIWPRSRKGKS